MANLIEDNSIVGGKAYVFVIVPNSLKSSSTSQVGGSKSSVENIITQGITTFTGLNLESYRVGKPLYPCFNHIKFTVNGTEKQLLIKKIISLAAQSISCDESFNTNPSVQLCINKIKDNISYMNNSTLPLGCSQCVIDCHVNSSISNNSNDYNSTIDAYYNINNKSMSFVNDVGFNIDSSIYRETNINPSFQYDNDQIYLSNHLTPDYKRFKYSNDSVHDQDNESTSKFKSVCGHSVRLLDNYCCQCGEQVVIISNSKCGNCGSELTLSTRFCSNCGFKNVNYRSSYPTADLLMGSISNQDLQESDHE